MIDDDLAGDVHAGEARIWAPSVASSTAAVLMTQMSTMSLDCATWAALAAGVDGPARLRRASCPSRCRSRRPRDPSR